MMKKLLLALSLVAASIATADTATTGGARVVENPTSDGNLVLRINDGGTKKDAISITGSTALTTIGASGETGTHSFNGGMSTTLGLTVGPSGAGFVKAGGANSDLTLEAVGSGGAVIFKTNVGEAGRTNQLGAWTLGPTSGGATHTLKSGGNTRVDISSVNSSADLVWARSGTAPGSAAIISSDGILRFTTGGSNPATPFATETAKITTGGEFRTNQALLSGTSNLRGSTSGAVLAGVSGNVWRGTRTGKMVLISGVASYTGAGSATGTLCMIFEGAPDADVTGVSPVCSVFLNSVILPISPFFIQGDLSQSFSGDGNPYACLTATGDNVTATAVASSGQSSAGDVKVSCTYITSEY